MMSQRTAAHPLRLASGYSILARSRTLSLPRVVACAFILAFCHGHASASDAPAEGEQSDLALRARAIFSAKYTPCHGADLSKPKGKFGYVLDLGRVAANPDLVVPFKPAESQLWTLVRENKMPPKGAKAGSLGVDEKEAIRVWIAAGAPAASGQLSAGPASSVAPPHEGTPGEPSKRSLARRTLRWLGQFHILIIHFPIALLLAAAAGEMWSMRRGARDSSPAVERFCVLLGAAGAVSAAALGWLHADFGGYGAGSGRTLVLHRWIGTAAGLCALATVLLSEWDAHRQRRSLFFRITFWTSNLLVAAAGHFGGTMVHGDDFLNW